jgi:hypothetical protein
MLHYGPQRFRHSKDTELWQNGPTGDQCARDLWTEEALWGRSKCGVVSEGCHFDSCRYSFFRSGSKRVFPTAFRCYLLQVWLMFWTFSIVLGLFLQLRFGDWLCPRRELGPLRDLMSVTGYVNRKRIFRHVWKTIAKSDHQLRHVCPSVFTDEVTPFRRMFLKF